MQCCPVVLSQCCVSSSCFWKPLLRMLVLARLKAIQRIAAEMLAACIMRLVGVAHSCSSIFAEKSKENELGLVAGARIICRTICTFIAYKGQNSLEVLTRRRIRTIVRGLVFHDLVHNSFTRGRGSTECHNCTAPFCVHIRTAAILRRGQSIVQTFALQSSTQLIVHNGVFLRMIHCETTEAEVPIYLSFVFCSLVSND